MVGKIITIGGALSVILPRAYTERTIPALLRQSLQLIVQKKEKQRINRNSFISATLAHSNCGIHAHPPDKDGALTI